jgi:hypothetical protein
VVVVNPTVPIGAGDHNMTPPAAMLDLFLRGGSPFFLDCVLNLVAVRDLADGIIRAADAGRAGERYILGGDNIPLRDLLSTLQRLSGRRMPKRAIPPAVALAAGTVSEALVRITGGEAQPSREGVLIALRSAPFDSSKAKRELGYAPRPIEGALAEAVQWLEQRRRVEKAGRIDAAASFRQRAVVDLSDSRYLLQIGHKMKLAALTLVGLGLVGAAQAQVQTNPAFEQRYLPVPELLPELPFDTGLSAIDAVMFSQTMRGAVQDESATPPTVEAVLPDLAPTVEPAVASKSPAQPSPQTVAVQDPTVLIPEAEEPPDAASAEPDTAPAAAEPEKPAEKPKKDVITVIVEGVESSKGTVNVAVCDTALSREGCPFHTEVKASPGSWKRSSRGSSRGAMPSSATMT